MYRSKNTPFQILVPDYREPISGVVATAMALGALVQYKTTGDARELIAADGGLPAILEQQVMADADWQAHCKLDPQWSKEIRKPVPVDSVVSARFAKSAEFEGTAYFDGIDGDTAAGLPLKTDGGKFALAVVTVPDGGGAVDRVVAYLQRKVTPVDSESFRWVVDFV